MNNNISLNTPNITFKAKPIPKSVIEKTKSTLLTSAVKRIDIYCHDSADEDTVNSSKVFANWLIRNGKNVSICVQHDEVTDLYLKNSAAKLKLKPNTPDKTVVLDFNSEERLPRDYKKDFFKESSKNIIGYDHHDKTPNTLKGNFYIDSTAKSCCSIMTRFFEGLGEKINSKDSKSLYCGMVSDYKKSGLVKITNKDGNYELIKTDKLLKDKNSMEVMTKLENNLAEKDKKQIYKHLDPLSRLNADETTLRKKLFSNIKVTNNGKLAYVVIEPDDKLWAKVGMDTQKTSEILKDLRERVSSNSQEVEELTKSQKEKFKNVDTVIAFYRKSEAADSKYRMSIHSKSNSALKLIDYVRENKDPNLIAGGHSDRAGGEISSVKKSDVQNFVNNFIEASKIL